MSIKWDVSRLIEKYEKSLEKAYECLEELEQKVENEEWDEETYTQIAEEEMTILIYQNVIRDLEKAVKDGGEA